MPGWSSLLQRGASYVGGAARGGMAGITGNFARSQSAGLGYMGGFGAARAGRKLMTGGYGATATGAAYGGIAGGAYGAVSDDTSVLGGMAMGAGMGAGGGRYGMPAVKYARAVTRQAAVPIGRAGRSGATMYGRMGAGAIAMGAGRVAGATMMRDIRRAHNWGATQWSNRANTWKTLKNWRS